MRRIIYTLLFVTAVLSANAQKDQLFRGGMLPHAAYFFNNDSQTKINGLAYGIGGKLSFHLGPHFRLGTEGYVSTYNYKHTEGFYKFGWGGLIIEYQFNQKKVRPVLGLTFGGGGVHDLYMQSGDYNDNLSDSGIYKRYSSIVVAPQASIEWGLTDHVNLVCKADYLFYPGNEYPDYIGNGVRFYFGVLFAR